MIKTEALETLSSGVIIPLKDIITLNSLGQLQTTDGRIVTVSGGTSNPTDPTNPGTDTQAPIFDEPIVVSSITLNACTLTVSLDEPGIVYFVVVPSGAQAPSAQNVRNGLGQNNSTPIASGNKAIQTGSFTENFSITGLVAGNTYDIYITASDDEQTPNHSGVTKKTFTTNTKLETKDQSITILPAAIDSAQNNSYEIIQETGEPGWSKFQPFIVQNEFSLAASGGDAMMLSKIKFAIKSIGYQIVKILLYPKDSSTPIAFSRVTDAKVKSVSNPSIECDIQTNGFMLVTNATYESANILSTDKMPVAGTSGWFSLTTNTDNNSAFTATFNSPIEVASVRIYRCGASAVSFNGGTLPYEVTFVGNDLSEVKIEVPKVSDTDFVTLNNTTTGNLATVGAPIDIETKKHQFDFSYSLDGTSFIPATVQSNNAVENTQTGMWTVTYTYPEIIIANQNQRNIFLKIPDQDIQYLKNLKIDAWYLE